ncbi:MAG: AtpZ/AtpI family protein [Lentisphaeraceae bacterium]|nr:AtpZ/AtpI family protein [Lentisphaeraceae bacterium]
MNSNKNPFDKDPFLASAMGLGTQFAVAIGLFAYGGVLLDRKFESSPWGLLSGLLLAFVYGVYEVWKVLRLNKIKADKKDDENRSD